MSDLTSVQWSIKTTEQLQAYEQNCSDIELFCVGYLIPPVELLELEHADRVDSLHGWNQLYQEFVEQCMLQDKMSEDDQQRILRILQGLTGH
jgi:hypothetical protein